MSSNERKRQALIRHFHLSFYKGATAISALGTYYTFFLVAQPDPTSAEVSASSNILSPKSSRTLIAVTWLLFLLSFGFSTAALLSYSFGYASTRATPQRHSDDNASAALSSYQAARKNGMFGMEEELSMTVSTGALFLLILTAFLISCLAVIAYMPAIGIIGVAVIAIFIFVSIFIWIRQIVMRRRSKRSSMMMESGRMSRNLNPDLEAGLWNMMTAGGSVPMYQQPAPPAATGVNMTPTGKTGTISSTRPSTRRHQPIIIRDPRIDSVDSTP